jgi:hypothetical protein
MMANGTQIHSLLIAGELSYDVEDILIMQRQL